MFVVRWHIATWTIQNSCTFQTACLVNPRLDLDPITFSLISNVLGGAELTLDAAGVGGAGSPEGTAPPATGFCVPSRVCQLRPELSCGRTKRL